MATIQFRAKVETVYNVDDSPAYQMVRVPQLRRAHCDMPAFRRHAKFGGLANSDLFPNVLNRIRRERLGDMLRLDKLPPGVEVDTSGFLARVALEV